MWLQAYDVEAAHAVMHGVYIIILYVYTLKECLGRLLTEQLPSTLATEFADNTFHKSLPCF